MMAYCIDDNWVKKLKTLIKGDIGVVADNVKAVNATVENHATRIGNLQSADQSINTQIERIKNSYLPLSGGRLTGDIDLPKTVTTIKNGGIVCGGSIENLTNLDELKNYKTFIGSVSVNKVWNNIISVRHRNGHSDGPNYGAYIKTPTLSKDNLKWNNQIDGRWNTERTILDSSNVNSFVTIGKYLGAISPGGNNLNSSYLTYDSDTCKVTILKSCRLLMRICVTPSYTDHAFYCEYSLNGNSCKIYINTPTTTLLPDAQITDTEMSPIFNVNDSITFKDTYMLSYPSEVQQYQKFSNAMKSYKIEFFLM